MRAQDVAFWRNCDTLPLWDKRCATPGWATNATGAGTTPPRRARCRPSEVRRKAADGPLPDVWAPVANPRRKDMQRSVRNPRECPGPELAVFSPLRQLRTAAPRRSERRLPGRLTRRDERPTSGLLRPAGERAPSARSQQRGRGWFVPAPCKSQPMSISARTKGWTLREPRSRKACGACSGRSGVAADEQEGGDPEHKRAVADEEHGSRPRRERMGTVCE